MSSPLRVDTATGKALERLRLHHLSEIQATRFAPDLEEGEKRKRIEEIRRKHAISAQRLLEETRQNQEERINCG